MLFYFESGNSNEVLSWFQYCLYRNLTPKETFIELTRNNVPSLNGKPWTLATVHHSYYSLKHHDYRPNSKIRKLQNEQ